MTSAPTAPQTRAPIGSDNATGNPAKNAVRVAAPATWVIDTNIVLDLFVFADEAARPLRAALEACTVRWLATTPMRAELERVLDYPQIAPRLAFYKLCAADVLAAFDRLAHLLPVAAKAPFTCRDADDQGFVDLAVAHGAGLISKDAEVLALRKRLAVIGVYAGSCWPRQRAA